jgi:hypothetical protein
VRAARLSKFWNFPMLLASMPAPITICFAFLCACENHQATDMLSRLAKPGWKNGVS